MANTKKYKVKHTSIMHNGLLAKEGSIIELTDAQAKRLEDFVDLVVEPKTTTKSTNNKNTKNTTEEKSETTTKDETDGGENGK